MATKKGICKNVFNCSKADSNEVQEIDEFSNFKCSECEAELEDVNSPHGGGKSSSKSKWKKWAGIAAVVVCCGGGIYFALSGTGKGTPVTDPVINTDSVSVLPIEDPVTVVMVESMAFMEKDMNLASGEEKQLNIDCTPGNASEEVTWSSSDETVARVNSSGAITGVATGNATITATAKNSGVTASILAKVKGRVETPPVESGTKDLGYAIWTGKMKNGKPHDTQGTLKFKTSHVIDSRDEKGRVAGPGDTVIGTFENGHLTQGKWYKKDGNVESVILGGV